MPRRKRGRRKRILILVICVILLAALIAVFVSVQVKQNRMNQMVQALDAYHGVFMPNIYVNGVAVGGLKPEEAIEKVYTALNDRQNSWRLTLTYHDTAVSQLDYAALGIQSDRQEAHGLLEKAYYLGKSGTTEENYQTLLSLQQTPYQVESSWSQLDESRLDWILDTIIAKIEREPQDAYLVYFEPEDWNNPFGIQPESSGIHVDRDALKEQVLHYAANGTSGLLEIKTEVVLPSVTEKMLRSNLVLRAEGITPVSKSSTDARTDNIRTAFYHYNGVIAQPGEKVSFNNLVGPRTMENGFQYAIEYAEGMNSWGVGGGSCQASTTVYLAALKAGLKIVSRTSHSDQVSYTTFGQDATVYYSSNRKIDLVFENTSGAPIYIAARVENVTKSTYQCVVRIYGAPMNGVTYALRTETVEILPAPEEPTYEKDTNHQYVTYKDEEPYLVREARDGFINETYLQRYENGVLVEETFISRDVCKERAALYMTGTKTR